SNDLCRTESIMGHVESRPSKRWDGSLAMRLPRMTVGRLMVAVAIFCVGLRLAPDLLRIIDFRTRGHAPSWVVPVVRERVGRLTPGMTSPKVWEELGLCRWLLDGGLGGGPINRSSMNYSLRPGCSITLEFDYTAQPPRLVSARLMGEGWTN